MYDMKRFIGRRWSDAVAEETKLHPFRLVDNNGTPAVAPTVAPYNNQLFSPQQIGICSSLWCTPFC